MKRVARRVALNLSESKRFAVINQNPFALGVTPVVTRRWMYKNIFAQLPQAVGGNAGASYAVVGNEIVDLMLKAKFAMRIPYGLMLGNGAQRLQGYGTVWFHVYLVSTNDFTTSSSALPVPPPGTFTWNNYPTFFGSDDPGWFLQQDPAKPTLNGNNVRVIRRWTKKYQPEVQQNFRSTADTIVEPAGDIWLNLQVKHKFRGKKTFEDNVFGDTDANFQTRSGVLRGTNYYWLLGWGTVGAFEPSEQPSVRLDEFMYYKDP